MSRIFFGGSRKLSRLDPAVRARLGNLMTNEHAVLIGDADGADKAIQAFLAEEGYRDVTVYCMDGECRNNIGNWSTRAIASGGTRKDFKYFAVKDAEMSRDADHGFMLWDGRSKGTLNNILNLVEQEKPVLVYFSPNTSFVPVKSASDLYTLLSLCEPEARAHLEDKVQIANRAQPNQGSLNLV